MYVCICDIMHVISCCFLKLIKDWGNISTSLIRKSVLQLRNNICFLKLISLSRLCMRPTSSLRSFRRKLKRKLKKKYFFRRLSDTNIIGHYNPSVRIIDLVSHTTYVVCVLILYISGGIYSLKSAPNDRFFWETFHGKCW